MYVYESVSFTRTIECPYCHDEYEVSLEDYLYDASNYERENGMEVDKVYSFNSEENHECPFCWKKFCVSGWIREYPMDAYASEAIDVEQLGEEEDDKNE